MSRGDRLVESGAQKLESLAEQASQRGGVATKLAEPLAEDAEFLRKLRPSLIAARARGKAPTAERPTGSRPAAPPQPKPSAPPKRRSRRGGPNPFLVAGVALAAGVLLAKWIDWRGHAHPRG